jgi:hypothetical protein
MGGGAVIAAPGLFPGYGADTCRLASAAKAAGKPLPRPDAVVWPHTEEEVLAHSGIVIDSHALDKVRRRWRLGPASR